MSSIDTTDICNLDLIYNSHYEYSLPRTILEGFVAGKAFDNKVPYTEEERRDLIADINTIYQEIMAAKPVKEPLAVMTAGAPGAGKTTLMVQDIAAKQAKGKEYAYICPDGVCLPKMHRTYLKELQKGDGSASARLAAYNKWRPASNAANHIILANLIREKYAFYFGTTSTSPQVSKFFDFLKKHEYKIKLLHVTAPDDVRWESIKERDKTFVQTTEQDVKEKGDQLPQRIKDFLAYGDVIEFYYRDGLKKDAELVAFRSTGDVSYIILVSNQASYDQIKRVHNSTVVRLNLPGLLWEETVDKPTAVTEKTKEEKISK